jgi:hypothetical protein
MVRIEELEAEAAAEETAARAEALTDIETRVAAALERRQAAREERAAAKKKRRVIELEGKEREARAKVPAGTLVKGVDLLDLFPLGEAPPEEKLPGNGLIVLRHAPQDVLRAFHREAEAKQKDLVDIYADVLVACCVEPDARGDATTATHVRAFCDAFGGAAIGAGDIAVKLGGSKQKAEKRGRG